MGHVPASESGHAWRRDIDAAVRQVIGSAVDADDVIDLFAVAGLSDARIDILGDEFLGRVAALEQKNLALETLRKLLNDQIRITERTNIVRSRKFREALEDAMLRYTNRAITTAEMISRLIDLAKSLRDAQRHGDELGLSPAETAFYDALAENGSAREAMQSDTLRLMARKLTEMVRNMPKLDWTQRESVRANLRRNVRRLLAKYGYPPDLAEDATQLVLRQAELSTRIDATGYRRQERPRLKEREACSRESLRPFWCCSLSHPEQEHHEHRVQDCRVNGKQERETEPTVRGSHACQLKADDEPHGRQGGGA
ncbi:MAG: DUF3387 domain-containing protein [Gammaproteobacteria bacterium]|nr:DUF3387 domain-containing protein [Gammaproteobacteria bacterium]